MLEDSVFKDFLAGGADSSRSRPTAPFSARNKNNEERPAVNTGSPVNFFLQAYTTNTILRGTAAIYWPKHAEHSHVTSRHFGAMRLKAKV